MVLGRMSSMDSATRPVAIELDRTRELRITWADGKRSVCPLPRLRQACPCAECRQTRATARANPLRVIPGADAELNMVIAAEVRMVGHYGLQLSWLDGHSAGIYDYGLLRALADSAAGAPGRNGANGCGRDEGKVNKE